MKKGRQRSALAALLAFGLFLAACSSGEPTETTEAAGDSTTTEATTETTAAPTTETTEAPAAEGGIITTYITEPEFLQPPQTNESEGNAVLTALFRGLIDYDPETSEPRSPVSPSRSHHPTRVSPGRSSSRTVGPSTTAPQ